MINLKEQTLRRLTGGVALGAILAASPIASVSAQEGADSEDLALEEVVVTGSRIARSNMTTPNPINAVSSEDMKLAGGADISETLAKVPSLMNSLTTEQRIGAAGANNIGASFLSLRGLGQKRTLVLVDGKRHVGGRAGETSVDINSIPAALIERTEIMTGGASAVYGADAVTGVVNFILKKNFEGIEADARVRANQNGDGLRYEANITAGSNFDDGKGNVVFHASYADQEELRCGQQDWCEGNATWLDYPTPEGVSNELGAFKIFGPDTRFNISSKNGRIAPDPWGAGWGDNAIWTPELADFPLDLNNNGTPDTFETVAGSQWGYGSWLYDGSNLRFFDEGQVGDPANSFGGDGIENFFDFDTISPPIRQVNLYTAVNYQVTDSINFYANAKYVNTTGYNQGATSSFGDLYQIGLDNPFIPTELRAATEEFLAIHPQFADTFMFNMTRDFIDMGVPGEDNERSTWRIVTGLEGEFSNGWTWEVSYNYGETKEDTRFTNNRIEDRFFAAIDVTTDANGNPVCQVDMTPGYTIPGDRFPANFDGTAKTFTPGAGECVPMNIFGNGAPSQAAIDWIMTDELWTGKLTQEVMNASIVGDSSDLFELPGGPVGFAAGWEYRKETSDRRVGALSELGYVFDGSKSLGTAGVYEVKEFFGEVNLPILSDVDFAKELSVSGAVRYADYSTAGSATSYMANMTWAPVDDIRFRATYSVALRAPNISELFQPLTSATNSPDDPCDITITPTYSNPDVVRANCQSEGIDTTTFTDPNTGRINGLVGGNADLLEEESTTYTIGAVFTPSAIPGLDISVDYWNIKLEDAIVTIDPQDVIDLCYTDPNGLDNPFCNNVGRNPNTQGLNFFKVGVANVAQQNVEGIDFDVNYRFELDSIGIENGGELHLNVAGTYLMDAFFTPRANDPDTINPFLTEIRNPKWAVNTNATWTKDDLTVRYNLQYMSNQAWSGRVDIEDGVDPESEWINPWAGDAWIHNISASYMLTEELEVYGGINNIADKDPFKPQQSYPVSSLGRTLFLGAKVNF